MTPIYEYNCDADHRITVQRKMNEPEGELICPKCKSKLHRIYNVPGVIFKGTGFYSTSK